MICFGGSVPEVQRQQHLGHKAWTQAALRRERCPRVSSGRGGSLRSMVGDRRRSERLESHRSDKTWCTAICTQRRSFGEDLKMQSLRDRVQPLSPPEVSLIVAQRIVITTCCTHFGAILTLLIMFFCWRIQVHSASTDSGGH